MSAIPWTFDDRPDTRTSNIRMGMWLFLASEAMFFGSLISAYVLLRSGAPIWPDARDLIDVRLALVNTVLLLASAAFLPGRAGAGGIVAVRWRLLVSAALAAVFLILKSGEYGAKFDAGLYPSTNILLACWFTLTFIHALHVAGGVASNVWVAFTSGDLPSAHVTERIRAVRLYWYFVDLVWLILLIGFYFI
jgi:cytochrome c oxidase subunit III